MDDGFSLTCPCQKLKKKKKPWKSLLHFARWCKQRYNPWAPDNLNYYKMHDRRKPDNCIVEHFLEVTARNKMYISMDYEQHSPLIT